MRIKEQDGQRMVIAPAPGERVLGILAYLVLTSVIALSLFFVPPLPGIILVVVLLLYGAGELTGRIVIDRLAESITKEKWYFLLVRRRQIVPFWQVTGVVVDYKRVSGAARAHGVWRVYLDVSGQRARTLEIEHTRSEEEVRHMAGEISRYIGKGLVVNSSKPVEPASQAGVGTRRNAG